MNATEQTSQSTQAQGGWMIWLGRVLTALPVLLMLMSGSMKLAHAPQFLEQWTGKFGYPESAATFIGLLEIACAILYLIPRTAVLGAILLTGFLGGAVATHVRISDPAAFGPFILGMIAWGGLFLRDARLRALLPLRTPR